jgi:hypothetical protein
LPLTAEPILFLTSLVCTPAQTPGVTGALAVMMREGPRQGAIGMASDIVAGSRGDPLPLDGLQAAAVAASAG